MIINRKYFTKKYEEASIQVIDSKDFTKNLEFCPIEITTLARYIGVGLNEENKATIVNAFFMACKEFEQRYSRSIIPKTYCVIHERHTMLLPRPPIRKILSVDIIKQGGKWERIYVAPIGRAYEEEIPTSESIEAQMLPTNEVIQKRAEYGMMRVMLNEKYNKFRKVVTKVVYEAGYCAYDGSPMPGSTMLLLMKLTRQIYFNQDVQKLEDEAELYFTDGVL